MDAQQVVTSGQGKDYDYSQDHCFVKVASQDHGGNFCMVEDELKPGFHLARHHHKIMTEIFYILEGEVKFTFDDETVVLGSGDTLTIPPHIWHAASCELGGRMLTIFKEGRFDQYLEKLSSMTDDDFQDAKLIEQINAEYDTYIEAKA